jgi:hypothetical protein
VNGLTPPVVLAENVIGEVASGDVGLELKITPTAGATLTL